MSTKIEEIEKRRAEHRAQTEKAELEQYEKDLEVIEQLEIEHDRILVMKVRFVRGQPTRAVIRAPSKLEYQRYRESVGKAVKKENARGVTDAQDQFAKSVWIYPTEAKDREAMLEAFPGLVSTIVLEASKLAEGKADEEGKD